MVWEWRVFYPSHGLDVWELLGASPRSWRASPEKRTDSYLWCSSGAGVKLRGQRSLEVKLRAARHECGAEQWEKVLHTPTRWDGQDTRRLAVMASEAIARQRDQIVKRWGSTSLMAQTAEDVIGLGRLREVRLVALNKTRVCSQMWGVTVEQTDITADVQPGAVWRSVCVEGNLKDVVKLLQREVEVAGKRGPLSEHLAVASLGRGCCGYPDFIASLLEL